MYYIYVIIITHMSNHNYLMSEIYGISLTNLHALLITKELAGLINHLPSKEERNTRSFKN